ncbi:MAG: hypothetical protein ACO20F_02170 [Robiginitalea sp.]
MNSHRLYIAAILLVPWFLAAQNNRIKTEESSLNETSFFLADISFVNDAVFMGRNDSIAAPYILPSFGYYDKSGFFVDASLSYLVSSQENRVDLFLGSTGFLFSGDPLSGGISGTVYFFNEDSYNVKSMVVGDISGFLSYDFKIAEVSLLASTYFNDGSSADIFMGLMLDRMFYNRDKSFFIDPMITLYAGTQYFYQEYYRTSRLGNRKDQGQGSGDSNPVMQTNVDILEVSEFNILNIELSVPVYYSHKDFIFSFSPALALPQSSTTLITEDAVIEEDLQSTFYFSIGISYFLKTKKNK